jgi:hypothetical protein
VKQLLTGYARLFCLNAILCTTFFLLLTGKPKLFFVSVKCLQGLGKLHVLVQTADIFIQAKKKNLTTLIHKFSYYVAQIPITEIWGKF